MVYGERDKWKEERMEGGTESGMNGNRHKIDREMDGEGYKWREGRIKGWAYGEKDEWEFTRDDMNNLSGRSRFRCHKNFDPHF